MPFFPRFPFERRVLPVQELNVLHSANKVDVLQEQGSLELSCVLCKATPGAGLPVPPPLTPGGDEVLNH